MMIEKNQLVVLWYNRQIWIFHEKPLHQVTVWCALWYGKNVQFEWSHISIKQLDILEKKTFSTLIFNPCDRFSVTQPRCQTAVDCQFYVYIKDKCLQYDSSELV